MKKFTFILVALIVATFANAQITKVFSGNFKHFGSGLQIVEMNDYWDNNRTAQIIGTRIIGNYIMSSECWNYDSNNFCYDIIDFSSMTVVKSFCFSETGGKKWFDEEDLRHVFFISKGLFSTDGKWAGLVPVATEQRIYGNGGVCDIITEIQVCNEDGVVLTTIPCLGEYDRNGQDYYFPGAIKLVKAGDTYKLFVPEFTESDGSLSFEGVYSVYSLPGDGSAQDISTPSAPQRAIRKIVRNGQVLVETESNTYMLHGQEVK